MEIFISGDRHYRSDCQFSANCQSGYRHPDKPEVVTIDKNGANADKPEEEGIIIRQGKYLNNLIKLDHLNIKRLVRQMQGANMIRQRAASSSA